MQANITTPQTERLWATEDGTVCLLAVHQTPPMYGVSLVRGEQVLRERRLYDRASAQMLAEGWNDRDSER